MSRWVAVALFLVFVAGCSTGLTPATAVPLTPTAAPSPLKIIPFFTTENDPGQLELMHTLIDEYQSQHPDVEVDVVIAWSAERGRRLLTALSSGADLGIFEVEPTLIPQWVDAGYLLPLDDIVADIGADDFVDGSLYTQDGHVYALPYAVSVYGLWVRKDLLDQAGLPIPSSYEEILNAARLLTKGDRYGISLPAGHNIAAVNYFSIFLWQNGGDYFSCDGKVTFGQPQALEAVRRWADLARYAPPGYSTWSYREQIDTFLSERVAMSVYGGRLGVQLVETNPELADKVTVVFPPFGDTKVTLGIWSRFAIAAGTKHQAEAKNFLEWLTSGDRLLRYDMAVPGHMIPSLKSVRQAALNSSDPFTLAHSDWIHSFSDWAEVANHPAMNMGSVSNGVFKRSETVPPWAWEVFGTPGIIDTMLQEIANGRAVEPAWSDAVTAMENAVGSWKSAHPSWHGECR